MSISHDEMVFAVGPDGRQTAAGFHVDSFLLQQDSHAAMAGGGGRQPKPAKAADGWAVPAGLATFERVQALLGHGDDPIVPTKGGVVPQKLMAALEELASADHTASRKRRRSRKAPGAGHRRGTRKRLGRK